MPIKNLEQLPEIEFGYSPESELNQLRYLLSGKKRRFFLDNNYTVSLPEGVSLDDDKNWSDEELLNLIKKELDEKRVEEIKTEIESAWPEVVNNLKKLFIEIGIDIPSKYFISFTNYGPGGQFQPPNGMLISISKSKNWPGRITSTVTHEAIHDAIHHLIEKYGFAKGDYEGHWIKEHTVDRLMKKVVPDSRIQKTQLDEEKLKELDEIFDQNYPNLEKILEEISKIKN
jgi:hypothetical protein